MPGRHEIGSALADREAPLVAVRAHAFKIPTEQPEEDGTIAWDSTTLVLAEVEAGGATGIGYTYADGSLVPLIHEKLAPAVLGKSAFDVGGAWLAMYRGLRNLGRSGLASTAVSALDAALWDLKAKLLTLPLARLLGCERTRVEVYGSGGFTSYDDAQLSVQLAGWVEAGCRAVKMKIGAEPARDVARVAAARRAIDGAGAAALFVDANGAYEVKQALDFAARFAEHRVRWLEEPVSADDLPGLRHVRDAAPTACEVAAGEYVYTGDDARRLLEAQAVDVLQADLTRCGGVTGFLRVAALCDAFHMPLSGHCAPAMHLHAACAAPRVRHIEWFHDHVRIESMLFDGAPVLRGGMIEPDWSRPGHGLGFKWADAKHYAI